MVQSVVDDEDLMVGFMVFGIRGIFVGLDFGFWVWGLQSLVRRMD